MNNTLFVSTNELFISRLLLRIFHSLIYFDLNCLNTLLNLSYKNESLKWSYNNRWRPNMNKLIQLLDYKNFYENIYYHLTRYILNSFNSLLMHSRKSLCVKIMKSYYYIQNNAAYWTQFRRRCADWKNVLKTVFGNTG